MPTRQTLAMSVMLNPAVEGPGAQLTDGMAVRSARARQSRRC